MTRARSASAPRVLAYLILALTAYAIGMASGSGLGFALFILGGGCLELLFWVSLLRRVRR